MLSHEDGVSVIDTAKRLVSDTITKRKFKKTCKVKYHPGSEAGDGFSTKTYIVDISDDEAFISLFLKCAIGFGDKLPAAHVIYATEIYFYKTIYPTYKEFLESKGVKDGFRNAPVSCGFDETKASEIIALENLRKKGFTLFDKFTRMNDEHLKLTLRTFAKFHAISFAMKDQRKDLHDDFCERSPNLYALEKSFPKMYSNILGAFIEKLDPIEDKDILDKCSNLPDRVHDQLLNLPNYLTNYSIFVKGDCWVNNMLILYENDDREHPVDVMLVDWQNTMRGSPVHDIEPLFHAIASKECLSNYKYYMQIYYEELSKRIKELGSDSGLMYPRSVFEKEWVDYSVYVLGIAIGMIKVTYFKPGNAPSFTKDMNKDETENMFAVETDNEEEYLTRVKYVVRHMIGYGAL